MPTAARDPRLEWRATGTVNKCRGGNEREKKSKEVAGPRQTASAVIQSAVDLRREPIRPSLAPIPHSLSRAPRAPSPEEAVKDSDKTTQVNTAKPYLASSEILANRGLNFARSYCVRDTMLEGALMRNVGHAAGRGGATKAGTGTRLVACSGGQWRSDAPPCTPRRYKPAGPRRQVADLHPSESAYLHTDVCV